MTKRMFDLDGELARIAAHRPARASFTKLPVSELLRVFETRRRKLLSSAGHEVGLARALIELEEFRDDDVWLAVSRVGEDEHAYVATVARVSRTWAWWIFRPKLDEKQMADRDRALTMPKKKKKLPSRSTRRAKP